MASTSFVNAVTLTDAGWFNDLNTIAYALSANRVPYATGSAITSSANLTFDGTTLTAHTLTVSTGAATLASIGGTVVASQAVMETATSLTTVVTPGRVNFMPGVLKGWLKCNAAGTVANSYNVTSITDTGTGDVAVTWGTDFSGIEYYASVSVESAAALSCRIKDGTTAAGTTSFQAYTVEGVPALTDPTSYFIAVAGDQ